MHKSTHSPEYQAVLRKLVALRKTAGLTQRQLAKRIKREYSFVWRVETGERRLDVVEFYWLCLALGYPADIAYVDMVAEWQKNESKNSWSILSKAAESRGEYRTKSHRASKKK